MLSQLMDRYVSHIRAMNSPAWYSMKLTYLKRFAKFMGDRPLSEVTPYDCQAYQQRVVASGVSNSSVNGQMAAIRHLFSMALAWEMMNRNPMIKIKKMPTFGRQRAFTDEEVRRIIAAADRLRQHPRSPCQKVFYHFIKTALLTGMRRGEVAGIRWMDFKDSFVHIPHPKEKRPKVVPIPPGLKAELLELNNGQEYIFQNAGREAIRTTWIKVCKLAGIRDARFHDLRHTFSTKWAQSGTSLVALQHTLGHSSLAMTSKYAHSTSQDQLDAVTALEVQFTGAKMGLQKEHEKA